jgi:uncharacterized protein (DUF3084 family)
VPNTLLELLVKIRTDGVKDLDRDLAAVEKRSEATEKRAKGLGGSYQEAAEQASRAVRDTEKGLESLGKTSERISKSQITFKTTLEGARQVQAGFEAIGNRADKLSGSTIELKTTLAGSRDVLGDLESIDGVATRIDGETVTVTADVKGGAEGRAQLQQLEAAASRIDGDSVTMDVEVRGAAAAGGDLEDIREAAGKLDGQSARVDLTTDGAFKTEGLIKLVQKAADKLDGKVATVAVSVAGALGASAALSAVGERADLLTRSFEAVSAHALPLAMTAMPALAGAATATGTALIGLVGGLGQGAAGLALFGGTALYGAVGGLTAFASAASASISSVAELEENLRTADQAVLTAENAVKSAKDAMKEAKKGSDEYTLATRELAQAQDELAAAQEEQKRLQILNTRAARDFNAELGPTRIAVTKLQAEFNDRLLPTLTKLIGIWTGKLPRLAAPFMDMTSGIADVAGSLGDAYSEGQRFMRLMDVLRFVASQGEKAAGAIGMIFDSSVMLANQIIPFASDLTDRVYRLVEGMHRWVMSAEGTRTMVGIFSLLYTRMNQLLSIAGDLGAGLFNVFRASGAGGLAAAMLGDLAKLARSFRDATSASGAAADKFRFFGQQGRVVLRELAGIVGEFSGQFFRMAEAALRFRTEGSRLTLLQQIFRAIRDSFKPLADMMIDAFRVIGPVLPELIRNLAGLANNFAGQTPVMRTYFDGLNLLLRTFNNLPAPIKNMTANLVALSTTMGLLGGPGSGALGGAIAGLVGFAGHISVVRAVQGKTTLGQAALNRVTGLFAPAAATAGTAAAASGAKMGIFSRAMAVAAAAGRGLRAALLFLVTNPIGLAITALAVGAIVVAKNWSKIRPALQPAVNLFNRAKTAAGQLGGVLKNSLVGNTEAARNAIAKLPPALKPVGKELADTGADVRRFGGWVQDKLIPALKDIGTAVAKWAKPAFDKLGQAAEAGAKKATSENTVMGRKLRGIWSDLNADSGTTWHKISRTITSTASEWANKTTSENTALGRDLRSIWSDINADSGTKWHSIRDSVVKWAKDLRLGARAENSGLNKDLSAIWADINADSGTKWHSIRDNVVKWTKSSHLEAKAENTALGKDLSGIWSDINADSGTKWHSIRDAIVRWAKSSHLGAKEENTSLKTDLSQIWDDIFGSTGPIWNKIADAMTGPMERAHDALRGIWNSIVDGINKVLGAVGIDKKIPRWEDTGGGGSAPTGPTGREAGMTGRFGMARGGIVHQWATGGLADGSIPHAVYGEVGKAESYAVHGRRDNIPYAQAFAESVDMTLVPKKGLEDQGHPGRVPGFAAGGILDAWRAMGVPMHAHGATMYQWAPGLEEKYWRPIANTVSGSTYNNYYGHPDGWEEREQYSADFWGPGGRGDPIGVPMGDAVLSAGLRIIGDALSYWIWNNRDSMGGNAVALDPHTDHVHFTAMPGLDLNNGGGGTGFFRSLWETVGSALWERLVQRPYDRATAPLEEGMVLRQAARGAGQMVLDATKEWIIGRSGSAGGSLPGGSSPSGLTLGEAVSQGDWPSNLQRTAVGVAWEESSANASAQNPSGARGLFQIMPQTAAGVGADYGRLTDPIYNSATGLKVYNAQGWGAWVAYPPSEDSMSRGSASVTGYEKGGLIPGRPGDPKVMLAHAGEIVLPRGVSDAFLDHARALERAANGGGSRFNVGSLLARLGADGTRVRAGRVGSPGRAGQDFSEMKNEIKGLRRDLEHQTEALRHVRADIGNPEVLARVAREYGNSRAGQADHDRRNARQFDALASTRR